MVVYFVCFLQAIISCKINHHRKYTGLPCVLLKHEKWPTIHDSYTRTSYKCWMTNDWSNVENGSDKATFLVGVAWRKKLIALRELMWVQWSNKFRRCGENSKTGFGKIIDKCLTPSLNNGKYCMETHSSSWRGLFHESFSNILLFIGNCLLV